MPALSRLFSSGPRVLLRRAMATSIELHSSAAGGFVKDTVKPYEKGRPEWEGSQFEAVLRAAGVLQGEAPIWDPIVEIGPGTGKSTRPLYALLTRLSPSSKPNLTCVEPSDLSSQLVDSLPDVRFIRAMAEDMRQVPSASAGAVMCMQAFHWFSNQRALSEIHRVLKPGGVLILGWNTRDHTHCEAMAQLESAIDRVYDADPVPTPRQHTGEWRRAFDGFAGFGPVQHLNVPRSGGGHIGSEEEIVAWALSISVIAKLPEDRKAAVAEEVRRAVRHPSMPRAPAAGSSSASAGVGYMVPMRTDFYWARKP